MVSRASPYHAPIRKRELLSSSRNTWHIELDIEGAPLSFEPGDSIGILPENPLPTVEAILDQIQATGSETILDRNKTSHTLRNFLLRHANISKASFHKIYDTPRTTSPLIDLLDTHKPSPQEMCDALLPLLPRFYSIASSPLVHPNELHLLVASADFILNGRTHHGVGSYFLCWQASTVPLYVQPSNHFALPDPATPIILIGPGTGVAPFRAFLQHRLATQATGLNWLFFGERNQASDFYYNDFFQDLQHQGRLRLDTAFSRDQAHKIYVQHKMLEEKKSIWEWINRGAHIYVCGDAHNMAKDVDLTLQQIAAEVGHLTQEDARLFIRQLRHEKRYLLDVY